MITIPVWLFLLMIVNGIAVGLYAGVIVIGGWRKLRADLRDIDREHLEIRRALAEMNRDRDL